VKQLDTIEPYEKNLGKKIFHNECISNAGQDFNTRRKRNSYINAESDTVPTDTTACLDVQSFCEDHGNLNLYVCLVFKLTLGKLECTYVFRP
jgi:hypothetical protein